MKRIFVALVAIIILCFITILIAPSFVDLNIYKDKAISELKGKTGLELDLSGDIDFSLLPTPRFIANDVSILSPKGSKSKKLLSFKRLSVNIDLFPLFSGQVSVKSITLVEPIISLEMLENNTLNMLTKELENISSKSSKSKEEGKSSDRLFMPNISMDKIRIKDGQFSYFDHKSKNKIEVQNINADLSIQSLIGPFSAQGSMFYDGRALNFEVQSDKYDVVNKILSPKATLTLQPGDITINYAGVINMENDFSMQGQTILRVENLKEAINIDNNIKQLNNPLEIKGLLTATAKNIDYKDFDMSLGYDKINGSLRVDLLPFRYNLSMKSTSTLDLREILPKNSPFKKGSFEVNVSGNENKANIKNTILNLDNNIINISGQYINNSKKSSPFIDLNASSEKIIWKNNKFSGIDLSAKMRGNKLVISNLSIKNIANSSIKISGEIKDLQNRSGITAYVDLKSKDIRKLAQFADVDTSSWASNIKSVNVKAKVSGSSNLIDLTSNISAMNGEVIISGKVKKPLENLSLDNVILQIKHKNMAQAIQMLTGTKLQDPNLKKPMDIYTKISQTGNKYELNDIKGDLSGSSVRGQVIIDTSHKKPKISGDLKFGNIRLASTMKQNKTSKNTSNNKGKNPHSNRSDSHWSKEQIDTSALHLFNADISLDAQQIKYGAWSLINPSLNFNLKDGVLNINDLKSGLFGGNIKLSSKIQSVPKPRQPIYFESKFVIDNANLYDLSKAMLGKQLVKISGNGTLNMDIKTSGASPAALISDLSGNAKIDGSNIILDGVDINQFARALSEENKISDTVSGIWKGASRGGQSSFDTLDGAFQINHGVVQINKMDLDGAKSAIETKGSINLPSWTLATKHKIIVKGVGETSSDIPPFEITLNGSLDNPSQTFGKGLLNDYINRKIQRKFNDLLSKKLGVPSNDNQTPEQAQQQPKEEPDIDIEDTIKDVLGDLLR